MDIPQDIGGGRRASTSASPKQSYAEEGFQTLYELRRTFWTKDTETFDLYIDYIRNSIVSQEILDTIEADIKDVSKRCKEENLNATTTKFQKGMVVIKAWYRFITDALDLVQEDIMNNAYDDLSDLAENYPPKESATKEEESAIPVE